ncbi:MAG: hypothetical protein K6C12_05400 [Oscillospiraceae bacterium]|nr:hypothetical protein [Oscillospiraceae bacterium]
MNSLTNQERKIRLGLLAASEAFALFSTIFFLPGREWTRTALAAVTVLLLLLPEAAERGRRLSMPFYVLCLFYALGAMLGHSYKLYYKILRWDELLHLLGGFLFALVGFEIARSITGSGRDSLWFSALFGLCFSMAIALVWEFFEYGMDTFFGMDMQNDTVVHSIVSYQLGTELGVTGGFPAIHQVVIDGTPLALEGYLDVGLHDTMADSLVETLGAVLAVICYVAGKGETALFRREAEPGAASLCV